MPSELTRPERPDRKSWGTAEYIRDLDEYAYKVERYATALEGEVAGYQRARVNASEAESKLVAENAALLARVEAGKADTLRWEWLERHGVDGLVGLRAIIDPPTLRAAIDAAMREGA